MKKLYMGAGLVVLVVVGFVIFGGASPRELTAVIGGSGTDDATTDSSVTSDAVTSGETVAIADTEEAGSGGASGATAVTQAESGGAPTASPASGAKATATPKPTATVSAQAGAGSGTTGSTGGTSSGTSSSTSTSTSGEAIGANNAMSVKGTGTTFKLIQGDQQWLTVNTSSTATVEVIMSNMSFSINIISAQVLPMTFSFKTTAGKEHFVFKNDTSRYSLELVPASGLMEYTINAAPAKFTFAAGFEPGTWNKNTPDPVSITVQRPPKSVEGSIPGMLFWSYDLGKKYKEAKGTFAGVCSSSELRPSVYIAQSYGKAYKCNESASAFAISVHLPTANQDVCVDSVGNKIGGIADIGTATTCK